MPSEAEVEAELKRQRAICAVEPDCVARAPAAWGKRIHCRCAALEAAERVRDGQ